MATESLLLDGLDLNSFPGGGTYLLQQVQFTPAKKRPEWAENSDGDGSLLIRDPYFENSQWDATVEVRAATRDAAHAAVGAITDKLEEAERNALGIPLVWSPADSTKALTFYVLTGEIAEVPITVESGYFASPPVLAVSLTLTCRPFGYGAEVTVTAVAGAGPLQIFTVSGVTGDVPAEARLIVTDTATQSRDFCAWGLEQRYNLGADLLLTQPDLTATGFAGTSTTRAGSVSTNIFRGTLTTTPVAVCGTGNQPHVGSYRVYGRFWATGTGVRVRLSYREGDGSLKALEWETPTAEDAWVTLDLGIVSIPPKLLGTQRWQAQVEAYTDIPGDTLDVDYLILMPADPYGRARKPPVLETPKTFIARDEFDQAPGALATKTLPVGGTWGAGTPTVDADDFSVTTSGVLSFARRSVNSDTAPRLDRAGTGTATSVVTQTDTRRTQVSGTGAEATTTDVGTGVFARYTDTSNYAGVVVRETAGTVFKKVAGAKTDLGSFPIPSEWEWVTLRFQVDASGRWYVWAYAQGQPQSVPVATGQDTALATGGTLASGGFGIYDYKSGSTLTYDRDVDNFVVFVPVDDAVCFSGQSIEFRSDDTIREDSSGTYWGRPKEYRGAPFFIPPAGDEARDSRVAVMLRRNDIYTMAEPNVADNQSVEVRYVPRFLYLPR